MQVFKAFCKIIMKSIKGTIIYFAIFIGLAVALTMNSGGNELGDFEQVKVDFVVDNKDKGALGKELVDYLSANNNRLEYPKTEEDLMDGIFNRSIEYVLVIPENFTASFEDGKREGLLIDKKAVTSQYATLMDTQINQYVGTVGLYLNSGFSLKEAISCTKKDMEIDAEITFLKGKGDSNENKAYFYFQYLSYIFVSIVIACLGVSLMVFQRKDILSRNACSSTSFMSRNIQIILGAGITVIAIYGVFMLIAFLLYFDFMCSAKGILCMINAFIFIIFTLSLAYLCSQLAKGVNGISMFSNIFGLGLAFLGGVFVPLEIFSSEILKLSKFFPTYWYVTVNNSIQDAKSVWGASAEIYQGFGIQLIYAGAIFCLALLIGRGKAQKG